MTKGEGSVIHFYLNGDYDGFTRLMNECWTSQRRPEARRSIASRIPSAALEWAPELPLQRRAEACHVRGVEYALIYACAEQNKEGMFYHISFMLESGQDQGYISLDTNDQDSVTGITQTTMSESLHSCAEWLLVTLLRHLSTEQILLRQETRARIQTG